MRFGVCGGISRFDAIRAAGADYLEPSVAGDARPEGGEKVWAECLARIRDTGLRAEAWNCWLPGDLKIVGPAADWDRYRRYVDIAIPRVREAGAEVIVFGSGGARTVPAGYEHSRALDDLARALSMACAGNAGIVFAVEALGTRETNLINSVAEAAAFVRTLNLPYVKCTADLYHMNEVSEPASVLSDVGRYLGHAHLADSGRGAPGTGTGGIVQFLSELRRSGYDARVSIEADWADFDAEVAGALRFVRDACIPVQ
ncbi:MAG TPA: sugar phosphate isomerase/epimerase family protein [Armatimonadota bacterium]|jgi:sugar phosphate isomerase/epimerase